VIPDKIVNMESFGGRMALGERQDRRSSFLLVLAVLGIWVFLGTLLGIQAYLNGSDGGTPLLLGTAISVSVRRYLVYAVLTFPGLWLCRRFPFTSQRWAVPLLAHAIGLLAFIVLYAAIRVLTLSAVNWSTLERVPSSVETAKIIMRSSLFEQFWMYWSMMTAILAIQHYRQLRQRERREAELKRQMAEYELQVLKLQLHPHFLFNTLNGIATLMSRDVKAAREMLVRLSELLRIALARSADNEVSLRDELAFVKAYLELEQMRFGERLIVQLEIEPATLDAQVPNMIIQPLVENAIQYGIALIRGGGTIMLETARQDGRLRIRVVNDGPLSADGPHPMKGSGIGLANTRARLGQLYGEDYRLQIVSRSEGGVELHLEIPFHGSAGTAECEA